MPPCQRRTRGESAGSAAAGRARVTAGAVGVVPGGGRSGLVLRFDTRSALWLDEALTVNISSLPLHSIPGPSATTARRPSTTCCCTSGWQVFGTSDLATRSLAGVIGVATLPVAWLAGRRLGGPVTVAWVVLVLVASAPFAVFYSTEARMYSLVILLTGCGFLALHRALAEPRPGNLVATAVVDGAAALHPVLGALPGGGHGPLAVRPVRRAPPPGRRDSWKQPAEALAALAVGVLAFAPWVPTFLYQSKHTGTPWGAPANFAALTNAVTGFTANQGVQSTIGHQPGPDAVPDLLRLGRAGPVRSRPVHPPDRARPAHPAPGTRSHLRHRGDPDCWPSPVACSRPARSRPGTPPSSSSRSCCSSDSGRRRCCNPKGRAVLVAIAVAGRPGHLVPERQHPADPGDRGGGGAQHPGPTG